MGALTLAGVNELDRDGFVAALGHAYEDTPALAAAAWERRPFADLEDLVDAFHAAAADLPPAAVLALLRAHPELATDGPMTSDSEAEQRSAGLSLLDAERRADLVAANARYSARFGFPFIIAVRGLTPADVAAALAERLQHDELQERATALAQVMRIAELRIEQAVSR